MINPVPAKITRPRPLQVSARTRLFRVLGQARAQPVIWITAPPEADKPIDESARDWNGFTPLGAIVTHEMREAAERVAAKSGEKSR